MAAAPSSLEGLVERAIRAGGAARFARAVPWLLLWLDRVVAWNARIDLTAARTPEELVDLMLGDALVLAERVRASSRAVDVGSGAGAPGLALALLRDDLEVTLVEALQKRVSFLRTVVGSLARGGTGPGAAASAPLRSPARLPRVERARGDEVAARGGRFDVAISRATLGPAEWLALGARLAPRGEVWVLLAKDEPPELAGWEASLDLRYAWPLTGASRRAVRFEPVPVACRGPTPAPRAGAEFGQRGAPVRTVRAEAARAAPRPRAESSFDAPRPDAELAGFEGKSPADRPLGRPYAVRSRGPKGRVRPARGPSSCPSCPS